MMRIGVNMLLLSLPFVARNLGNSLGESTCAIHGLCGLHIALLLADQLTHSVLAGASILIDVCESESNSGPKIAPPAPILAGPQPRDQI
eukprot:432722-Amphidinium_carterae.1